MDQDSAHMVAASKVPMLKLGEYEIWRMRIEQYIQMIDYALWEVIENGATLPKTKIMEGVMTEMPITTAEEKAQRRLEVKARSTLMMGIPNEHQLKFNSIKDAKKLLEAVEKRFGRNAATRKTQRNLLKQQYENFTTPSSEMLDQTFDRLQKLVSQLELLDERTLNKKMRNKADLDTMSMDDLYNNLKVYEPEVKGMSSSSSSTQNMAFVSSSNNNTSNTNEAVNTAHGVSTASTQVNAAHSTNFNNLNDAVIYAFYASQPNGPQLVPEDLQQIYPDDIEEMDLRWQMAMLTIRARRFLKNTERKLTVNTIQDIKQLRTGKALRRIVAMETSTSIALVSCDGLGNFMLPIPNLSFTGLDEFVNELVVENCKSMSSEEELKVVRKYDDAPSIEEWVSNDEEEDLLVNTARQVNVAHSKTTVNAARPMSYLSKIAHSTVKRHIYKNATFTKSNINQRGNTVRGKKFNTARAKAVVNAVKGNNVNAVKASACWIKVSDGLGPQKKLVCLSKCAGQIHKWIKDQGVIDRMLTAT
ncbi:hypothetical protein Tco_1301142 [Tanacetum coccineum]